MSRADGIAAARIVRTLKAELARLRRELDDHDQFSELLFGRGEISGEP